MKIKLSQLRKLIRESLNEQGSFTTNMPDNIPSTADVMQKMRDDGMGPPDEASADRDLMVDEIASEIVDAMDSSSLTIESFNELVDDMIDQGKLDGDMYVASDIDYSEIKDRVIELEDEYGFEGDNAEDRFMERVGEGLAIAGEGGMDIYDIVNLIGDSLMDDTYGTGFDRASILKAMSSYVNDADKVNR
jgi:hypothetical protein